MCFYVYLSGLFSGRAWWLTRLSMRWRTKPHFQTTFYLTVYSQFIRMRNPRRGAASIVTEFSIFVCFQLFLPQNNPLVLVGFYQNLYHHASNAKFSIFHRLFRMKNLQDACKDNVFCWINPVEKCTRSFPRCYVNRGKVTSLIILVIPLTAPSIIEQVTHSNAFTLPLVSEFTSISWCLRENRYHGFLYNHILPLK
jgi:hypothetical protein